MDREFNLDYIERQFDTHPTKLKGASLEILIKKTKETAENISKPEEHPSSILYRANAHIRLQGLEKLLKWRNRFSSSIRLEDLNDEEIRDCLSDLPKINDAIHFSEPLISSCLDSQDIEK